MQTTWNDLLAKGVEQGEKPTERAYGTNFGLRDPFGRNMRIGQLPGCPARHRTVTDP